jgi:5'-nucleotidase
MQMRILLTNDDGITSPGLAALRSALEPLGDVITIAPDHNNSAVARGITTDRVLHAERARCAGFEAFTIDGTPVDCVHVALLGVLAPAPQAIVSGINLGANTGLDVSYSGTVGAAIEGALHDLPSVAVSVNSVQPSYLDQVGGLLARVISEALSGRLPPRTVLNVNVPDLPAAEIKGYRATSLGGASCSDYVELAGDGLRAGDFRMRCEPTVGPPWPHTDAEALAAGYIALTPLGYDLVDPAAVRALDAWQLADLPAIDAGGAAGR